LERIIDIQNEDKRSLSYRGAYEAAYILDNDALALDHGNLLEILKVGRACFGRS